MISQFPHCDPRVLHRPGDCTYCDRRPQWQELREAWGIAFTGQPTGVISTYGKDGKRPETITYTARIPEGELWADLPCPADFNRPPTGEGPDHRRWAGNVATSDSPVNETTASRAFYGCRLPPPGWVCSRQVGHEGPCAVALLKDAIREARRDQGFMDRLRGNVAKHRDLLGRLRDR